MKDDETQPNSRPTRRTFLKGAAAAVATGIAGCKTDKQTGIEEVRVLTHAPDAVSQPINQAQAEYFDLRTVTIGHRSLTLSFKFVNDLLRAMNVQKPENFNWSAFLTYIDHPNETNLVPVLASLGDSIMGSRQNLRQALRDMADSVQRRAAHAGIDITFHPIVSPASHHETHSMLQMRPFARAWQAFQEWKHRNEGVSSANPYPLDLERNDFIARCIESARDINLSPGNPLNR